MKIGAGVLALTLTAAVLDAQTQTGVLARMAMNHAATFHFLETFQTRGRLVLPDLGYVDFGRSVYREVFGGGGWIVHSGKRLTWIQELYFDQALGPASRRSNYLQPWTLLAWSIPKSAITGEAVYFTYLPLGASGRIQYVLDRAKLEHGFRALKLGAGYASYRFADAKWENKPFITSTFKLKSLGSLELWLQRIPPHGLQVQIRYARVFPNQ